MLSLIKIKFYIAKIARESTDERVSFKEISEHFVRGRFSKIVDVCCEYIACAQKASELHKRFKQSMNLVKYLCKENKETERKLKSALSRKRDVILLEHISYWNDMGNTREILQVIKMPDKFSHGVREQAKHILAGWEIYTYCKVRFPQSSAGYYYRTDINNICPGDKVLVPVGEENELTEAVVSAVGEYTYENVPYPIDKTKSIYRRVE